MTQSWLSRLLKREPDPAGRRRAATAPAAGPSRPAPDAGAGAGVAPRPAANARLNAYQAVSVIAGPQACAAACQLQGQRFLARQAPRLPHDECDRPQRCACRFAKYPDRRTSQQRSPYNAAHSIYFAGVEKRRTRGRRSTD